MRLSANDALLHEWIASKELNELNAEEAFKAFENI
jgi:hypothetical protein